MRTSRREQAGRGRRVGRSALAAAAVAVGFAANATAAQAVEEKFTFDHSRINLGDQKGVPLIDPSIPDPHATITGDLDSETGAFTAPASGFSFPDKALQDFSVSDPIPLTVDALVEFEAIDEIEGEYDPETGELALSQLDVSALITVYLDGTTPADAIGICRVEPIPLPLATTGELIDDDGDPPTPVTYAAAPFTPEGAAIATWEDLPASTAEGGSLPGTVCPAIDGLLGGPGGIWLSGVDGEIEAPPPPDGDGDGVPDAQDQCPTVPGPAANNGCPQSNPRPASLTIEVTPPSKKAKPNKRARFTARVANGGEVAAEGTTVCVEASKKVKGTGCETLGSVAGAGSSSASFALKAKRKGKHRLTFTASATGAATVDDQATLKVKRKRGKRK